MGAGIKVDIDDHTPELLAALKEHLPDIMDAIGATAEGHAKQLCPVDTGRLRNSITHAVTDNGRTALVGSAVEYAAYVEFGSSTRKPKPYIKPAVANHHDEYQELFEKGLQSITI